jgi:hypothetical protein
VGALMAYRYANANGDFITDGNGKFIPCSPDNADYRLLEVTGELDAVLPYEAPESDE